ncbi:Mobile element protein [Ochrobactrum soli]|uniref:Mobile element protein n=1 Tax=Ochrobactrum soli TaxID=2448455 RepID=A0A2P9HEX5_9HYPH|nr:Mobile element protein [[Ochrobactrum] soli]
MSHQFQRTGLALDGFLVVSVEITGESVQILLRSRSPSGLCPSCGRPSRRVQSRYLRRPADLPLCGRRTQRMETIVHYLGLALGGRPAAAFVERLMVPVSNDTLLRVVRRRTADQNDELTVIGSDDFAFRRGQTYGTIICDLKRRRPVTLLPDRALDTSRAWLAVHQSISIVARDRGGGYGEVIAKALPDAEQVADRWHLMENSSRALLDAVGNSMRQIRQAVGSNVVDPKLLTYAERLQYEGYLRRQKTNEAIRGLAKEGLSIRQIVRQTGDSRKLVRNVLRGQRLDVFRTKPSSLDSWLPWLNNRWEEGARNALAVWREMKAKSFPGQSGVVSQWVQRRPARYFRVDSMKLPKTNSVYTKMPAASIGLLNEVLWPAQRNPHIRAGAGKPALGGHQHSSVRMQCLMNKFLRNVRTVGIRRIDEINIKFGQSPQRPQCLWPICRFPPDARACDSHCAKTEAIDLDIASDLEGARLSRTNTSHDLISWEQSKDAIVPTLGHC